MSNPSEAIDRLRRALTSPTHGVLGLVDELLAVSCEHSLRLEWQAGRCRLRFLEVGNADTVQVPVRKSVVRSALARVGVLCNEQRPNSVPLYGGCGELSVRGDPATVLRVAFANTPDEQYLELIRVASAGRADGEQSEQGTVQTAVGFIGEDRRPG